MKKKKNLHLTLFINLNNKVVIVNFYNIEIIIINSFVNFSAYSLVVLFNFDFKFFKFIFYNFFK